jgi:hypothetical protein
MVPLAVVGPVLGVVGESFVPDEMGCVVVAAVAVADVQDGVLEDFGDGVGRGMRCCWGDGRGGCGLWDCLSGGRGDQEEG